MKVYSHNVNHAHDHHEKEYLSLSLSPTRYALASPVLLLLKRLLIPFAFSNVGCKGRPGRALQYAERLLVT